MSETQLQTVDQKQMVFTPEQVQLLKRTVCKEATDDEFAVFLNVCKKVQLDPFAKQIWAVKYKQQLTTQVSIDGLRLIADRTGCYAPGKAPSFTYNDKKELESATAYIMKKAGDQWFEVAATAYYKEYVNSYNSLWQKLPHGMLSKCAEALALRRAFPNETSGLYAKEEMEQETVSPPKKNYMPTKKEVIVEPVAEVVDVKTGEVKDEEIPFGEAPEVEKVQKALDGKITEKQARLLFARWHKAGFDDDALKKHLSSKYQLEHTKDLHWKQFKEILEMLDGLKEDAPSNS